MQLARACEGPAAGRLPSPRANKLSIVSRLSKDSSKKGRRVFGEAKNDSQSRGLLSFAAAGDWLTSATLCVLEVTVY